MPAVASAVPVSADAATDSAAAVAVTDTHASALSTVAGGTNLEVHSSVTARTRARRTTSAAAVRNAELFAAGTEPEAAPTSQYPADPGCLEITGTRPTAAGASPAVGKQAITTGPPIVAAAAQTVSTPANLATEPALSAATVAVAGQAALGLSLRQGKQGKREQKHQTEQRRLQHDTVEQKDKQARQPWGRHRSSSSSRHTTLPASFVRNFGNSVAAAAPSSLRCILQRTARRRAALPTAPTAASEAAVSAPASVEYQTQQEQQQQGRPPERQSAEQHRQPRAEQRSEQQQHNRTEEKGRGTEQRRQPQPDHPEQPQTQQGEPSLQQRIHADGMQQRRQQRLLRHELPQSSQQSQRHELLHAQQKQLQQQQGLVGKRRSAAFEKLRRFRPGTSTCCSSRSSNTGSRCFLHQKLPRSLGLWRLSIVQREAEVVAAVHAGGMAAAQAAADDRVADDTGSTTAATTSLTTAAPGTTTASNIVHAESARTAASATDTCAAVAAKSSLSSETAWMVDAPAAVATAPTATVTAADMPTGGTAALAAESATGSLLHVPKIPGSTQDLQQAASWVLVGKSRPQAKGRTVGAPAAVEKVTAAAAAGAELAEEAPPRRQTSEQAVQDAAVIPSKGKGGIKAAEAPAAAPGRRSGRQATPRVPLTRLTTGFKKAATGEEASAAPAGQSVVLPETATAATREAATAALSTVPTATTSVTGISTTSAAGGSPTRGFSREVAATEVATTDMAAVLPGRHQQGEQERSRSRKSDGSGTSGGPKSSSSECHERRRTSSTDVKSTISTLQNTRSRQCSSSRCVSSSSSFIRSSSSVSVSNEKDGSELFVKGRTTRAISQRAETRRIHALKGRAQTPAAAAPPATAWEAAAPSPTARAAAVPPTAALVPATTATTTATAPAVAVAATSLAIAATQANATLTHVTPENAVVPAVPDELSVGGLSPTAVAAAKVTTGTTAASALAAPYAARQGELPAAAKRWSSVSISGDSRSASSLSRAASSSSWCSSHLASLHILGSSTGMLSSRSIDNSGKEGQRSGREDGGVARYRRREQRCRSGKEETGGNRSCSVAVKRSSSCCSGRDDMSGSISNSGARSRRGTKGRRRSTCRNISRLRSSNPRTLRHRSSRSTSCNCLPCSSNSDVASSFTSRCSSSSNLPGSPSSNKCSGSSKGRLSGTKPRLSSRRTGADFLSPLQQPLPSFRMTPCPAAPLTEGNISGRDTELATAHKTVAGSKAGAAAPKNLVAAVSAVGTSTPLSARSHWMNSALLRRHSAPTNSGSPVRHQGTAAYAAATAVATANATTAAAEQHVLREGAFPVSSLSADAFTTEKKPTHSISQKKSSNPSSSGNKSNRTHNSSCSGSSSRTTNSTSSSSSVVTTAPRNKSTRSRPGCKTHRTSSLSQSNNSGSIDGISERNSDKCGNPSSGHSEKCRSSAHPTNVAGGSKRCSSNSCKGNRTSRCTRSRIRSKSCNSAESSENCLRTQHYSATGNNKANSNASKCSTTLSSSSNVCSTNPSSSDRTAKLKTCLSGPSEQTPSRRVGCPQQQRACSGFSAAAAALLGADGSLFPRSASPRTPVASSGENEDGTDARGVGCCSRGRRATSSDSTVWKVTQTPPGTNTCARSTTSCDSASGTEKPWTKRSDSNASRDSSNNKTCSINDGVSASDSENIVQCKSCSSPTNGNGLGSSSSTSTSNKGERDGAVAIASTRRGNSAAAPGEKVSPRCGSSSIYSNHLGVHQALSIRCRSSIGRCDSSKENGAAAAAEDGREEKPEADELITGKSSSASDRSIFAGSPNTQKRCIPSSGIYSYRPDSSSSSSSCSSSCSSSGSDNSKHSSSRRPLISVQHGQRRQRSAGAALATEKGEARKGPSAPEEQRGAVLSCFFRESSRRSTYRSAGRKLASAVAAPSAIFQPPESPEAAWSRKGKRRTAPVDESLYFTFKRTLVEGKHVPLANRQQVLEDLHALHTLYGHEICRRFRLRYTFLAEHHPQERKAGVTIKKPVQQAAPLVDGQQRSAGGRSSAPAAAAAATDASPSAAATATKKPSYLSTIRIRLRKKEDHNSLISRPTQLAIFFHELAHLRHMNHGKEFARFLRDIFQYAASVGLVQKGWVNELPSPWKWEQHVFETAGDISDETLFRLFENDVKAMQEAKRSAGSCCSCISDPSSPVAAAAMDNRSASAVAPDATLNNSAAPTFLTSPPDAAAGTSNSLNAGLPAATTPPCDLASSAAAATAATQEGSAVEKRAAQVSFCNLNASATPAAPDAASPLAASPPPGRGSVASTRRAATATAERAKAPGTATKTAASRTSLQETEEIPVAAARRRSGSVLRRQELVPSPTARANKAAEILLRQPSALRNSAQHNEKAKGTSTEKQTVRQAANERTFPCTSAAYDKRAKGIQRAAPACILLKDVAAAYAPPSFRPNTADVTASPRVAAADSTSPGPQPTPRISHSAVPLPASRRALAESAEVATAAGAGTFVTSTESTQPAAAAQPSVGRLAPTAAEVGLTERERAVTLGAVGGAGAVAQAPTTTEE